MNVNVEKLRHLWYTGPYYIWNLHLLKGGELAASENWLTLGGEHAFDRKGKKTWILCRNLGLTVFLLFQQNK